MNCQDFEGMVRDLADAETRERRVQRSPGEDDHEQALSDARVHLGECEACALRLQDERMLTRKLATLSAEMKALAPPARIEQELLHAFRQTVSQVAAPQAGCSQLSARTARSRTYGLAAAVVIVLLGVGIAGLRSSLRSRLPAPSKAEPAMALTKEATAPARNSTPAPDNATVRDSPGSIPPVLSPARNNDKSAIRPVRRTPQKPARRPAIPDGNGSLAAAEATPASTENQSQTEIVTQFIALSYAGPASLQDGGLIVRVELPRSAMASFGLPVNMDRFGEKVKADVLVSADGFARAIRFVQ